MIRITNVITNLNLSSIATDYSKLQIVRWRKPRWLGTAKSKLFKVPPRCVNPIEEKLEIQRLYNNYRNHVKSVKTYLVNKYSTANMASADPEEQKRVFIEDFNRCNEINNRWNEKQRIIREKRVSDELEGDIKFAKERLKLMLLKEEKKQELVEEIVRKQKEVSFITKDNVDSAIEQALTNEVDYNFAIDLDGQKIIGRNTAPQQNIKEKIFVKQ